MNSLAGIAVILALLRLSCSYPQINFKDHKSNDNYLLELEGNEELQIHGQEKFLKETVTNNEVVVTNANSSDGYDESDDDYSDEEEYEDDCDDDDDQCEDDYDDDYDEDDDEYDKGYDGYKNESNDVNASTVDNGEYTDDTVQEEGNKDDE